MFERIRRSGWERLFIAFACVILCASCQTTGPEDRETKEGTIAEPEQVIDPYAATAKYEFDAARTAFSQIEEEIRTASSEGLKPEKSREVELRLIEILQSTSATEAGKQFACRMLRRVGSAASVPALASLLPHDTLTDAARFALQGHPSEEAGIALREALGKLEGEKRIGIIGSLAQRHDAKAVPLIAGYLESDDPGLAKAAISALGTLGTDEATGALMKANLAQELDAARYHACIECAYAMKNRSNDARALRLFRAMTQEDKSVYVRAAAWQGLCEIRGAETVPNLIALLDSEDVRMADAARGILSRLPVDGKIDAVLTDNIETAAPRIQVALIRCVTARDVEGITSLLMKYSLHEDQEVRHAAMNGLAAAAGEGDLAILIEQLERLEEQEDRDAMTETILAVIARLPEGEGRTRILRERYAASAGPSRNALITLLGKLPDAHTLPVIEATLSDPDRQLRKSAILALAEWPDSTPMSVLFDVAQNDSDTELRAEAHHGIVKLLQHSTERAPEEMKELYSSAAALAMDADSLNTLITNSADCDAPWVLGFIRPYLDHPDTYVVADAAYRQAASARVRQVKHDALNCGVTLAHPCSEKYTGGGNNALTDGTWGSTSYGDGCWQGFNGADLIAVIDLEKPMKLEEIRLGYLKDIKSWIFPPREVSISVSNDGRLFRKVAVMKQAIPDSFGDVALKDFQFHLNEPSARYVKVHAKAIEACPDWHPGSGSPGWLFCDEIAVNAHIYH